MKMLFLVDFRAFFFSFQVADVICNFEFHDCLFFQPSFTRVRFRRMTFAAVYTFRRVSTLTSVISVSIRSIILTYRSGVFSTVIFMMSEPLAVKKRRGFGMYTSTGTTRQKIFNDFGTFC